MSQAEAVQNYHPATFNERGACLPLTTPLLIGARARLLGPAGLELVVPRASGGRGDYVTPWRNVSDLCQPGVHDWHLLNRVAGLRSVTPAKVREAGWQAAQEGFAGRRVRAASQVAAAAEQDGRAMTNYHLLMSLAGSADPAAGHAEPGRHQKLETLAKQALSRLATALHRDVDTLARALGALSALLAPIGLGERAGTARLPTLLTTLQALRHTVGAMPTTTAWEAAAVGVVIRSVDLTLAGAASAIAEARGLADDVPELMKAWAVDPDGIAIWLGRADWLSDGWAWLGHLWSLAAGPIARLQALRETVAILPVIPREAVRWTGFGPDVELPSRLTGWATIVSEDECNLTDTIMRNEALLALAA